MNHSSKLQIICAAVILTVGVGSIWGFGLGGVASSLHSILWKDQTRNFETVVTDFEGRPFIRVQSGDYYVEYRYRTLAGDPVAMTNQSELDPARLAAPYRAPALFPEPIHWRERIAGPNSAEKPARSWVFMRDANQPGHAYLACYDPKSKLCVGYLGREGFRDTIPPKSEQFEVGYGDTLRYNSSKLTALTHINPGKVGSSHEVARITDPERFSYSDLFVCDGDTIQQINLPRREVHAVGTFDDLVGVAIVTLFPPATADARPNVVRSQEQRHEEHRLLVRTKDKVILHDTFSNESLEFPIPDELIDKQILVSVVGMDRLMFHIDQGWWERGNVVELRTIKSDGTVESIETVQLERTTPKNSPSDAVVPAFLAPSLILWLAGIFVIGPIAQVQNLSFPTFGEGVREAWNLAWMGMVLVTIFSIILTTITYRWQRKYSRPNTALWTAFVFFTTLPGFLAYWVMHRREPMGACKHCGANVPQDRDLCAKCAAPLPAPKLLGTEIFA